MREALRPYYSVFRPLYRPILRSALFQKMGLRSFDAFLWRARSGARLSTFHPRYPFGLERGSEAKRLHILDPNNPCGHEPELAHLLDLLLPDDGVFLDVGSNYGYFAIYVAVRPNFHGRVHAFEPVSTTFGGLQQLVNALHCDEAIICHRVAISDRIGVANMEVQGIDPGLANIKDGPFEEGEIVQTVTLDSLKIGKVNFLKIDVEGHEAQALRGAQRLIHDNQPFIFLESWSSSIVPGRVFEPLRFLIDRGYQLYLPAWLQSNRTFFVGIGPDFARHKFALLPFSLEDRLTFPGNPINIFACPASHVACLGEPWSSTQLC
jgi:FkbM family methyltransferase